MQETPMMNVLRSPLNALLFPLALAACASTTGQICDSTTVADEPTDGLPLQDMTGAAATIQVTSPDFEAGGVLDTRFAFNKFGCVGNNEMPRIEWSDVPEGTQSLALTVHDPDAPTGVGFFHRVVVNLPAATRHLQGELPQGALDLHTDYGGPGYGGPCPPPGPGHRYVFSVYALKVPALELPVTATGALTRFMLLDNTLAVGRIVGTYGR